MKALKRVKRSRWWTDLKHWMFSREHPGQRVARVASGIVILVSCLVLLGWVLKSFAIKTTLILDDGYMRANVALGLLLSGISLGLLTRKRYGFRTTSIVQVCTIGAGAIGLLTLLQYAFGWNFGIDELLLRAPVPNPSTLPLGRMSVPAAIDLSLISVALWLLIVPEDSNRRHTPNRTRLNRISIAQSLALIVGVIAFQALLNHIFGLSASSWLGLAKTTMGGYTAFAFGVLASGVLALRLDRGWMQILIDTSIGSFVSRRFTPVVVVTPLIFGWLIFQGYQAAWYDANFAMSLMSIAFAVTSVGLIVQGASRLNQAEIDLTQNQETIRQQLAEIEAIYHTAPIGLGIFDRDLRFIRLNQRLAEINGLSIEAHLGRTVREIVPNLADQVEPLFRQIIDTGEPLLGLELTGETPAEPGVERTWIENWYPLRSADGQIIGINVVVQEITQRKKIEFALRQSEDRFRTLADNIAQFAWIADASGAISWYNQRWFDYTGTTLAEMQGWGWQAVHHPDHLDRVVERFRHCVEVGEAWEDTFPLRGHDGQYRWFLSRAVPIRDEQGAVLRWFGTNTDITDRKQLEDTLAAQTEELSRTNRLKDEFLAALSHELRTPLNPILGWTRMMREQRLTPTKTAEALEIIERNVKQQVALVDDLLDVSRVIQGKLNLKLQPVDLAVIVRDAIAVVQFAAQAKQIRLETQNLPPLAVTGDRDRLQQVFWNLLTNAVKFTPEGGRVEVTGSVIRHSNTTDYAQICVIDNGIGIPPEFLPHVFDHFRQADGSNTREYGGLGLGLSIVRHLVELHGGCTFVESPGTGQGTTLTIRIPLRPESVPVIVSEPSQLISEQSISEQSISEQSISEQSIRRTTALTGRNILLVDDDPDNLDLLRFLLQDDGAIVTALTSPLAALDLIAKAPPDLIVSDVGMPEINGYEFMRRLRALPGADRIPVIALTAFARNDDQASALEAGFQAYVTKPVDPLELLSILTDLAQG